MQEARSDARAWPMVGALLSMALLGGCSPAPVASGERPIIRPPLTVIMGFSPARRNPQTKGAPR